MSDWLTSLFSATCGQNANHTWILDGVALPCCQRCTGLYIGALIATALHLWLRPSLNGTFLRVHALCLVQLALAGLPWPTQGPVLRAISGALYASAVVGFLFAAMPRQRRPAHHPNFRWHYSIGIIAGLGLLLAGMAWDPRFGVTLFMCLLVAGAIALAGLLLANVALLVCGLHRAACRVGTGS